MFKIAIVVFRECLEISFLLGIILAVTKPIKNSRFYIILGSMLGIVTASTFALFSKFINDSFGGLGDEILDACVILLTAIIISFTVVWMHGYTKKVKKDISKLSEKISTGATSHFMLVVVVASVILREGAEIILFVYSIASAENLTSNNCFFGLGIGVFAGFAVGVILYQGLMKYAGKYIFKISTVLLTLIAAGLATEAAGILTSAGIIESFTDQLWDSSWLIRDESIPGKILNIIIGYNSKPNGMQITFYLCTIIMTVVMMKIRSVLTRNSNA